VLRVQLSIASLILFACFSQAFAQGRLLTKKPLKIDYRSPGWNKNPTSNDSSMVLLRDSKTGRIAKILLTETRDDSGDFEGSYVVSWDEKEIVPEVYILPSTMEDSPSLNVEKLIKDGMLLRKPYFLRTDSGTQKITIYDTKQQALEALEEYRRIHAVKPTVVATAIEAQANAKTASEIATPIADAAANAIVRSDAELAEKKRQDEAKAAQEKLGAAEKVQKKAQAKKLAAEANADFKAEKFVEAEDKFEKATALDPENKDFYYQYGVSLYKTDKFEQSLAVLNLADGQGVDQNEKQFFQGLNRMKLKDKEAAVKDFEAIRDRGDKTMGPSAAFYAGVTRYDLENYEEAKKNFEYVLDNSSDPTLDKQSESYIEQISSVMAFQKEKAKKIILSFNLGLMYDSNVLQLSNSSIEQGTASDLLGYRWTYGGTVEYRPIYGQKHEFSAVLAISDMYSTDLNFSAAKTFQDTDAFVNSIYFPYKYKGMAFGRGLLAVVTPGFETMAMNADALGQRETIINSTYVKSDNTLVMNEKWFSAYKLELRNDTSLLSSASSDEDATATKITLGTAQTLFVDAAKTKAVIGEAGMSLNNAKGKNARYTRFDLAGTYMTPVGWQTTGIARLAFYDANYSESTTDRRDFDTAITLGFSRPYTDTVTFSLNGVYTTNTSTVASSDYRKYLVMAGMSWTGFL
jgi:hypothetical protein